MDAPRKGKPKPDWRMAFADPTRIRTFAPRVRVTTERYRHLTLIAVEKLREEVEIGNGYAALAVVTLCLRGGALPPFWAVAPFLHRYDTWDVTYREQTLDDAFGVRRKNKHFKVQRRNARLRPFIVGRVLQLSAEGVKPIEAAFAKVLKELRKHPDNDGSISSWHTIKGIYYEAASKSWRRFFKALERIPKRPPRFVER
jgi:hypothetical protein